MSSRKDAFYCTFRIAQQQQSSIFSLITTTDKELEALQGRPGAKSAHAALQMRFATAVVDTRCPGSTNGNWTPSRAGDICFAISAACGSGELGSVEIVGTSTIVG